MTSLWLTLSSLLRGVFLLLWSVLWIFLAGLATLVTLNRDVALVLARRVWAPGLLWGAGIRFRPEPLPPLDPKAPYIYAMNHQSMLDIACAFAALPSNLRFVAKHSLAFVPFLGFYMWMTGMIFINRSHRRKAMESLRRAARRIHEGKSIIVYPEGTRSMDLMIGPFKKGPFALAMQAQVPIVPVAIDGTGRILRAGSAKLYPGEVRMKVGAPIPTAGRKPPERDALLQEVRNAIIALHQEIGGAGGDQEAIAEPGLEGQRLRSSASVL